ncbi:MAG: hypothetical protein AB8D52_02820 [Gammaproteobacteria bacterium]
MIKTKILVFFCLLTTVTMTGCAITTPITSPNGKSGYAINCTAVTIAHCYQKAGEMCGVRGYSIIDQKNESHGFLIAADRSLIVECK